MIPSRFAEPSCVPWHSLVLLTLVILAVEIYSGKTDRRTVSSKGNPILHPSY